MPKAREGASLRSSISPSPGSLVDKEDGSPFILGKSKEHSETGDLSGSDLIRNTGRMTGSSIEEAEVACV